ncbi:MAG: hypothetical protein PQ964_01575 [Methanobacteriaceae archaeon]
MKKILLFILTITILIAPVAATANIVIVTDPTGGDPNGAAAGSMSFAQNMFQSTFLLSKDNDFAVLAGGGGEGGYIARLSSIVETIDRLKAGTSLEEAASAAGLFPGARVMVGTATRGSAVGGSFDVYVVIVEDDGTITVTPHSGGIAVLPAGKRGAIIHLRNTDGNPMYGTATRVRQETAINIGRMIRDGFSATHILEQAFKQVSNDAGERYGGGGVNLVSGITTGDMFTPEKLNTTGYPMNSLYSKVCPTCDWSIGFPAADNHQVCPNDGTPLKTFYAHDALGNALTVTGRSVHVSVRGSDELGVRATTRKIVTSTVRRKGFNNVEIANSINRAIDNAVLVGVDHVEPRDINVVERSRAVGVYFRTLPGRRSSPPWELPVSSSILDLIGNIQTAIGIILVLLVLFRSNLIKSFKIDKI